jgi:hypothetical protein
MISVRRRPTLQDPYRLDDGTTERLLGGSLVVEDAPPRYRLVVRTLGRLRSSTTFTRRVCDPALAARLVDEVLLGASPPAPRRRHRPVRLAATGLLGALVTFTGLAAANALPGAAQSTASEMLRRIGVHVPDPNGDTGSRPAVRGGSGTPGTPDGTTGNGTGNRTGNGKGSDISGLAHTTDSTGVDKGAEISTDASGGKSQAGQHGAAGTAPAANGPPASVPPVGVGSGPGSATHAPPNPPGATTAETNSGGHSSAGSSNGGQGASHKP